MSVNTNQTNITPGTAFFQPTIPAFNLTWSTMTTAAVNTATLSTTLLKYVTPNSVIQAVVTKDDQQGGGTCWLVTSVPGVSSITYNIAANSSANSQLTLATTVLKY